jgi:hypothetical protein
MDTLWTAAAPEHVLLRGAAPPVHVTTRGDPRSKDARAAVDVAASSVADASSADATEGEGEPYSLQR